MLDITSGQMDLDDCDIQFRIININAGFSGVCGIITRRKNLHQSTDAAAAAAAGTTTAADGFYIILMAEWHESTDKNQGTGGQHGRSTGGPDSWNSF